MSSDRKVFEKTVALIDELKIDIATDTFEVVSVCGLVIIMVHKPSNKLEVYRYHFVENKLAIFNPKLLTILQRITLELELIQAGKMKKDIAIFLDVDPGTIWRDMKSKDIVPNDTKKVKRKIT